MATGFPDLGGLLGSSIGAPSVSPLPPQDHMLDAMAMSQAAATSGISSNTLAGGVWPNTTSGTSIIDSMKPHRNISHVEGSIRMKMEPIENGYILILCERSGEMGDTYFIDDIEKIPEIIAVWKAMKKIMVEK